MMRSLHAIAKDLLRCAAFATAMVSYAVHAAPEQAQCIDLRTLPLQNFWHLIDPAEHDALLAAARLPPERIKAMLDSDDPRAIGVAIFALDQQEDLRGLLSLRRLLTDYRATVPYGLRLDPSRPGVDVVYTSAPQRVDMYYASIMQGWFGVYPSDRGFDEQFGRIDDPWMLARPWAAKLARTRDAAAIEAIKASIKALPETLRWAIIAEDAALSSRFTPLEAKEELDRLSPAVKVAIDDQKVELPPDPLYRLSDRASVAALFARYGALTLTPDASPQHDHVLVVPPDTNASLTLYLPLPQIEQLERIAASTSEERRALLRSDDPIQRAEGIFAAASSGDIDSLVEARALLRDDRPAVGVWMPTADHLMIPTRDLHHLLDLPDAPRVPPADAGVTPLTVGGYLATIYRRYFGLVDNMSLEDMQAFIHDRAARQDSSEFAHSWSARYQACMTPKCAAVTVAEILNLPEDLRWAVAAEIMRTPGIDRELSRRHAHQIAGSMSKQSRLAARRHDMPPPPDPIYSAEPKVFQSLFQAFVDIDAPD